jgi:tetratricopeptide (TPR) repeat protein
MKKHIALRALAVILLVLAGSLLAQPAAMAQTGQAAGQSQALGYTPAEYNQFNAAVNEKDAATRVKLLDDFVAKYPESTLLPYCFQSYYLTYSQLQDYLKSINFIDKLLGIGDKVDSLQGMENARIIAHEARARLFFAAIQQGRLKTNEHFAAGRKASTDGLRLVEQRKKPENVSDEDFMQQNDSLRKYFYAVIGLAARQLKDYKASIKAYRALLAISPNDASTYYQLGLSYLSSEPPQYNDGFWAIARSIALKVPGEAQIRSFLRGRINNYQQPACERLLDAQLNELLALAAAGGERPEGFSIPSRSEIDKAVADTSIDAILGDLKAGGDRAKLRWLGVCSAEFPQLGGKVFEVAEADGKVKVKVFTAGEAEAIDAGTEPNLELTVEGQPGAAKLKKDDAILFAGMLDDFSPEPFLVKLVKVKIDPEYLPKDEQPGKTPAKKAPTKRPPNKRPPASR